MKRSDAVSELEDFIEAKEHIGHVKAEDILTFLEIKIGILPPFSDEIYSKTWRDGNNGYAWDKE